MFRVFFFSRCFLTFPQFLFFFKSLLSFFPTKLISDGDEKNLGSFRFQDANVRSSAHNGQSCSIFHVFCKCTHLFFGVEDAEL